MCGYKIDEMDALSCSKCPLRKDCDIRHCPNCGYSLIDTKKIINYFAKIKEFFINKRKEKK